MALKAFIGHNRTSCFHFSLIRHCGAWQLTIMLPFTPIGSHKISILPKLAVKKSSKQFSCLFKA